MKKLLYILVIMIVMLISACNKTKERPTNPEVKAPPYLTTTMYTKQPVNIVPLGYFKFISDPEAEVAGSIYIGVDPKIIPTGTFLYIYDSREIGSFRVAAPDDRAKGYMLVIYDTIEADVKMYVWAIIKKAKKDYIPPYAIEI